MVTTTNPINGKNQICWLDDSGGCVETCHYNDTSAKEWDKTYVGEIRFIAGKWCSKLKGSDELVQHRGYAQAKRFVENSVDAEPVL